MSRRRLFVCFLLTCMVTLVRGLAVDAATIVIANMDGPAEGMNDLTPTSPVGGNPGITVGEQRFNVLQHAADIWGSILPSTITITVEAYFEPLTCRGPSPEAA